MVSVFDIAAYILGKTGEITHMKLHRLAYYAQAWSLVWDAGPLIREHVEVWANGPIFPALYRRCQGMFRLDSVDGDISTLDSEAIETVDAVLDYYGDKGTHWLTQLSHAERPWRDARTQGGQEGRPSRNNPRGNG